MKIIRYSDSSGQIHHAAQQADGSALAIEGCIFGSYTVTDRKADVAKLLAPVDPRAILCIGLNYKFHAEESGMAIPPHPVLFMKSPGAVQNPGDPILLPSVLKSDSVDYECELAVVIGKAARNVSKEDALNYVLGYTCANDVSARDWQKNGGGGQWCRGKTFDTFCPLGPVIVTRDEIADPQALTITTTVNGEVMQQDTTANMMFNIRALISYCSKNFTLEPGDLILTGTPSGVGLGRNPQVFLKDGDVVKVTIDGIGEISNPCKVISE